MVGGWIKLHRSMLEWEWYKDANTMRLMMHLLLKANHSDSRFQGHEVPRGATITGIHSLSSELMLSTQQIRTALGKLKSTGEITVKSTNHFSIISITNWDEYQSLQQSDQQTDNKPITNGQPHIKNDKNVIMKEDKNMPAVAAKKKSRLSSDWELPDEWGDWALEKGLTHDQVVKAWPSFRDHHVGKGTLALDWQATWRTWVYNIINKGW